jgi:hypothetical protein
MKNLYRLPFHRLLLAMAASLSLIQAGSSSFAGTVTYDLNTDWSDSQNPNGVWSYNYNETPISTFQQMWWGQGAWGNNWIGDGCIVKGSYFEGITDPWGSLIGPAHDWQPGDVMMHAVSLPYGGESTYLNVTWTSPADGQIDISGRAWDGEIFADRDVAWTLFVAGKAVAQRDSVIGIYRDDPAAQFAANRLTRRSLKNIRVKQGDKVEFRVITKTYYGHFVGVDAKIVLKSRSLGKLNRSAAQPRTAQKSGAVSGR